MKGKVSITKTKQKIKVRHPSKYQLPSHFDDQSQPEQRKCTTVRYKHNSRISKSCFIFIKSLIRKVN